MILKYALFISLVSLASGLPNIRIQVNNENFKSPPYLLQAITQLEAAERNQTPSSQPPAATHHGRQASTSTTTLASQIDAVSTRVEPKNAPNETARSPAEDEPASDGDEASAPAGFSVVKEETIEEILDLDPESVLRLAPESILGGIAPSDYSRLAAAASTADEQADSKQQADFVPVKHEQRPHLAVASSHLKKPALASDDDLFSKLVANSTGAKSLVSPSVDSDETAPVAGAANLAKKRAPAPPDVWEPSSVMNGVTNASLVPATLTREYGHQTRTRITLGGGYVRDKSPPLVSPASSEHQETSPEKPSTPLERPKAGEPQLSGPGEESRVIEVPEKIVLPESALNKRKPAPEHIKILDQDDANFTAGAKPDNRCPRRGALSFEHPTACDKYFYCEDGYITEHVCPNGLLYGTRDMVKDYCVHRWKAVCGEKSIPNPMSSPGCRWQYGIFSVQGSPKCTPDFYECVAGRFQVRKCSVEGQVYDDRTKSCQFAEKMGCATEALSDFNCPENDQANTYWPFPRYFLNERALIHCVNDKPEIVRCQDHERVDPEHLHCVPIVKPAPQADEGSPEVLTARRIREKNKKSAQPAAAGQ